MKSPTSRPPSRRGRRVYAAVVIAWAVSLLTAFSILPPGGATPAAADSSARTVQGPLLWIPDFSAAGGSFGTTYGSVTVDQTQDVTHQMLHVTWSGFTPSAPPSLYPNDANRADLPVYPVRVYECRGTNPQVTDCYGSTLYNADPTKQFDQPEPLAGTTTPDLPSNMVLTKTYADSPTAADPTPTTGTGAADIEVWTAKESPSLGCDSGHPCSIVVEPNYGGNADGIGTTNNAPDCNDHTNDYSSINQAAEQALTGAGTGNWTGEECAWNERTVVPLHFAPTPGNCTPRPSDFAVEGLPMFDRAMQQWVTGACLSSDSPLTVQYSAGLPEPEARRDFLQGNKGADVALTAYPADSGATSAHPYTYAPLANAGIAVAFLADDPNTGQQIRSMKLNARLLAKLLTQSYDYEGYSIASVAGNPSCIFADPEFQLLNPPDPSFSWPDCGLNGGDARTTIPIVTGGQTDLVQQLTTWIADDPDASAFLRGVADPWGMKVDSFYKAPAFSYPQDSFIPQDSSGLPKDPTWPPLLQDRVYMKSYEWSPVQSGLDQVARDMASLQATCHSYDLDPVNGHIPCPQQVGGNRAMFAIIDTGRAAAFRWPTAALQNPAGAYVTPTTGSLLSAVKDMPTDPATGTQALPYGDNSSAFATDAAAYPLTTVQYAMAPTSGIDAGKAAKIAQFLQNATSSGGGQVPGVNPGALALGFAPLTGPQQTQAAAAIAAVGPKPPVPAPSTQTVSGGAPGSTKTAPGSRVVVTVSQSQAGGGGGGGTGQPAASSGSSSGASASSAAAKPTSSPGTGSKSTALAAATAGSPNPDQAGAARLILPILLIIGAVLIVLGPLGLLITSGSLGRLRIPRRGGQ